MGRHICVYMTLSGNTQRSSSQGCHSLAVSGRNLFPGKITAHIGTSVSYGEDQAQARGAGAAAGFKGPLGTLSSPRYTQFPTLTPTFRMRQQGMGEESEGRREKEGQELEWDRAVVAPEIWKLFVMQICVKALHCLP